MPSGCILEAKDATTKSYLQLSSPIKRNIGNCEGNENTGDSIRYPISTPGFAGWTWETCLVTPMVVGDVETISNEQLEQLAMEVAAAGEATYGVFI
jgi:hypothetical protein